MTGWRRWAAGFGIVLALSLGDAPPETRQAHVVCQAEPSETPEGVEIIGYTSTPNRPGVPVSCPH